MRAAARLRELREKLATLDDGDAPALSIVVPELSELLGAERTFAYGLSSEGKKLEVDFLFRKDFDAAEEKAFRSFISSAPLRYGFFNPLKPERIQRNVVTTFHTAKAQRAPMGVEFPKYGLQHHHQLRVLVCAGASLLAFVAAFRRDPFTQAEQRILGSLVPALQRRLVLETHAQNAEFHRAANHAALEALPAAAFMLDARGRIAHANSAGAALLDLDRAGIRGALGDSLRGSLRDSYASPVSPTPSGSRASVAFEVIKIGGAGLTGFLAIMRASPADPLPRLARAASKWALTRRQVEVLAQLVIGHANKTIAATLECAEATVEIHVTALLRRSETRSRAELVARFWTMS